MTQPVKSLREFADHAEMMAKDGWRIDLRLDSLGITVEITYGAKTYVRDVTWEELESQGAAAAVDVVDRTMREMGYRPGER